MTERRVITPDLRMNIRRVYERMGDYLSNEYDSRSHISLRQETREVIGAAVDILSQLSEVPAGASRLLDRLRSGDTSMLTLFSIEHSLDELACDAQGIATRAANVSDVFSRPEVGSVLGVLRSAYEIAPFVMDVDLDLALDSVLSRSADPASWLLIQQSMAIDALRAEVALHKGPTPAIAPVLSQPSASLSEGDFVTLRLTVDVTYDPQGESIETLRNQLLNVPFMAADTGLFTGDGSLAELDGWDADVSLVRVVAHTHEATPELN